MKELLLEVGDMVEVEANTNGRIVVAGYNAIIVADLDTLKQIVGLRIIELVMQRKKKRKVRCSVVAEKEAGVWFVDSGCSHHMTGDKSVFKELDKMTKKKILPW